MLWPDSCLASLGGRGQKKLCVGSAITERNNNRGGISKWVICRTKGDSVPGKDNSSTLANSNNSNRKSMRGSRSQWDRKFDQYFIFHHNLTELMSSVDWTPFLLVHGLIFFAKLISARQMTFSPPLRSVAQGRDRVVFLWNQWVSRGPSDWDDWRAVAVELEVSGATTWCRRFRRTTTTRLG